MSIAEKIDQARKAVAALLVPALVVLAAALLGGSDGGEGITRGEWLTALIAALGTSSTVYGVKNGESDDPNKSTPYRLRSDSGRPAGQRKSVRKSTGTVQQDDSRPGAIRVSPNPDAALRQHLSGELGAGNDVHRGDRGAISAGLIVLVVVVVLAVLFVVQLAGRA